MSVKRKAVIMMICTALFLVIVLGLMQALNDSNDGSSLVVSIQEVFQSRQFWVGMILPLVIFNICFNLLWGPFWKKFVLQRGNRGRLGSYSRLRWLSTVGYALYVVALGIVVWKGTTNGLSLVQALSRSSLVLVYGAVVGFFVLLIWLKPSEEKARAMETGDYTRVGDERHLQVTMRSAYSTLGYAFGAILVVGTLVDILVYRTLPVRSLVEAGVLLVIWQFSYMSWNKRM